MTGGEEVIDVKTIIMEMTMEIEGDKTLGEASVITIGIEAKQEKEVWHQGEKITEGMIVQMWI